MLNIFDKRIKKGLSVNPKLLKAISELGINLGDCHDLIYEHPDIRSGCWVRDNISGRDYIFVGSSFIEKFSIHSIVYILNHEILHRALYRDLHLPIKSLTNVVLDILINKVQYMSNPTGTLIFSKETLPKDKCNELLLVRCDVGEKELIELENRIPKVVELWKDIYGYPEINSIIPSATELYYKLTRSEVLEEILKTWEQYSEEEYEQQIGPNLQSNTWNQIETKVIDKVKLGTLRQKDFVSFSNGVSTFFEEIKIESKNIDINQIRQTLKELVSVSQLEEVITTIEEECGVQSQYRLYPTDLSDKGICDIVIGLTNYIPYYHNKVLINSQPKFDFYLDTSPSMSYCMEYSIAVAQRLSDLFPTTIKVFSGAVKLVRMEDILLGHYEIGSTTNYNIVVEDFIKGDKDVMIIVTDGLSNVSKRNLALFKKSNKKCYVVYFSRDLNVSSDLDEVSNRIFKFNLCCEKLQPSNLSL